MKVFVVFILLSAVAVISADLQSDINDVLSQLPQQQNPHHVEHPQEPIKSADWLEAFYKMPEVSDLVDFFERRGINIRSIFLNLVNNPPKYHISEENIKSGKIIANIKKTFSSPKMAEVIKQNEETSEEFKSLVEALKDPEFKELFYRALNAKTSLDHMEQQERGFFKKVWKKVLAHGISYSIPFAG